VLLDDELKRGSRRGRGVLALGAITAGLGGALEVAPAIVLAEIGHVVTLSPPFSSV
jgi:hypothetical protein